MAPGVPPSQCPMGLPSSHKLQHATRSLPRGQGSSKSPEACPFLETSIPGTAGGQGAEAAGELLREWHRRVRQEAGGPAALAGGGLGQSHPQLRAGGMANPGKKGFKMERGERNPKSKSEGAGETHRAPHPRVRCPGLTRQHEPPNQHHVPWVLAHICRRLQRLQQGRGGCLLKQKPKCRQLPGRHDGEVDPPL